MADLSPGGPHASTRVLVVDDEREFTATLSKVLARRKFDVVTASDGESALATFAAGHFDVVLLDVKMPGGLDGLQVLDELKRRDPEVQVILMTGHRAPKQEDELRGRAFALVLKPYPIPDLVALIEEASSRGGDHERHEP